MSVIPPYHGFLNVNKPLALTSHDVVARIRRIYKRDTASRRVGHAGTLDPLATGVLVLCLGQATRLSDYVMHTTKTYRATLQLGVTTTTYDAEGQTLTTTDASRITRPDVEATLTQFLGDTLQTPPMHSAIKIGGRKLYDLARKGIEVERPPRPIHIAQLNLIAWQLPHITIDVVCGAGTYIRSLAHDIGQALGVGAHLTALERRASGAFIIEDAIPLDELLQDPDWHRHIVPPRHALNHFPSLTLTTDQVQHIQHGRTIPRTTDHPAPNADDLLMAYLPDDHLLAILRADADVWRPHKVFPPDTHQDA